MKPLALYVHIPFCAAKCAYCDFASYPNRQDAWRDYLDAVIRELADWRSALEARELATVFIGGGTPSLLPVGEIARLLDGVRRCVPIRGDAEITMEANPGTLTPEKLCSCRDAGVNRLSLGAQAMDDRLLRSLGRIHTAKDVTIAVDMARRAGFDNLSLDLMYALPGQTMEDWQGTLDAATALSPEHLSAYNLIVEEGTPLAENVARGALTVPDDDMAVDMQRMAVDRLAAAGYARYEISNFARHGRECRHNIVYWQRGDYLGVGCAAHSLMDGVRFENPRGLDEYLGGTRRLNPVRLSREDAMEETLMLSTRMCRGMDLAAYRRAFGVDFAQGREDALRSLESLGLLTWRDGFLRLTGRGMEVQNAVVVELLDAGAE